MGKRSTRCCPVTQRLRVVSMRALHAAMREDAEDFRDQMDLLLGYNERGLAVLLHCWVSAYAAHGLAGEDVDATELDRPVAFFDPATGGQRSVLDVPAPARWAAAWLRAVLSDDQVAGKALAQELVERPDEVGDRLCALASVVATTINTLPYGWALFDENGERVTEGGDSAG